jgi:hypothetical protein
VEPTCGVSRAQLPHPEKKTDGLKCNVTPQSHLGCIVIYWLEPRDVLVSGSHSVSTDALNSCVPYVSLHFSSLFLLCGCAILTFLLVYPCRHHEQRGLLAMAET